MLSVLVVMIHAAPRFSDPSGLGLDFSPVQGATACWCAPPELAAESGCAEDVPCSKIVAHQSRGVRAIAVGLLVIQGHRIAVQAYAVPVRGASGATIEQLGEFLGGRHSTIDKAVHLRPLGPTPGLLIENGDTRMVRYDFETIDQDPGRPLEVRGYLLGAADELITVEFQATPAGIEHVRKRDFQLREALSLATKDSHFGASRAFVLGESLGTLALPLGLLALVAMVLFRASRAKRPNPPER